MRLLKPAIFSRTSLAVCACVTCLITEMKASQSADTIVFYTNGIFNTLADGNVAARELYEAVDEAAEPGQLDNVDFAVSYNSTRQGLDILEFVIQDELTDQVQMWKWASEHLPMPVWCQELMKQREVNFYKSAQAISPDLRDHTKEYAFNIKNGRNVIIVPHS